MNNTKLLLLLAKLEQLCYPAGELRGIGGVLLVSYPAGYIDDVLHARQELLDELQREGK